MNGVVHNLPMQFFTLGSSKIEVSELYFFGIVTTQYDHPTYVKHVLVFFICFGFHMCFSYYLGTDCGGGGGGVPKGLVQNLLMQFFTLGSSKMEVSETYFFDIVIT